MFVGNVLVKCERFKYQGSRSLGSGSGVSNKEPISVLTILYLVSYKLSMSWSAPKYLCSWSWLNVHQDYLSRIWDVCQFIYIIHAWITLAGWPEPKHELPSLSGSVVIIYEVRIGEPVKKSKKSVENSTLGSAPPFKCGIFHTFNFFEGSPKLWVSLIIIDHRLNWRQWLYGYLYIVDYSIPEEDWGWKVAGIY